LAASVTAYGRNQIMFAKAAIEKFYGNDPRGPASVIYGDTDSLFVSFNVVNPEGIPLKNREARQAVFDLTEEAGHFITQALKPPHDFEFDKAFDPIMIFSKKRYTGHMYETTPDEYVQKSMGIVMKRRDNAPILKVIYGGALRKLINDEDVPAATNYVRDMVKRLIAGEVSWSQLTITKSLRAEYANPQSIAHKVLADRIAARDPGNAPVAGDRIPYMYVRPLNGIVTSKSQGDKIELPSYAKEKGMQPDYEMYLENQLSIPISQLFSLVVEDMPGFKEDMIDRRMNKLKGTETKEEEDEYLMSIKEMIAYDILFGDIIKEYRDKINDADNKSRNKLKSEAMKNFFTPGAERTPIVEIAKPKKKLLPANTGGKQMKLDYMFDAMLISKKLHSK
jgi:DNA polymerase elongation subunit (family B)